MMISSLSILVIAFSPPPRSVAGVLEETARRSAALAGFSARMDYQVATRPARGEALVESRERLDVTFDDRRFKAVWEPELPERGVSEKDYKKILTFYSNDISTSLYYKDDQAAPLVVIRPMQYSSWSLDPRYLLSLGSFCPARYLTSDLSNPVELKLEDERMIDGYACVGVSWDSATAKTVSPIAIRGTYWICPELGYAVVRFETESRPTADAPWKTSSLIRSKEFVKVENSWIPRTVNYDDYSYYKEDLHHTPHSSITASFEEFKVVPKFASTDFTPTIPDGSMVRDDVRNTTYRKGGIRAKSNINDTLKTRMERDEAGRSRRLYRLATLVAAGLAAGVLVVVVVLRLWRLGRAPQ
jgi:hypothetical protein